MIQTIWDLVLYSYATLIVNELNYHSCCECTFLQVLLLTQFVKRQSTEVDYSGYFCRKKYLKWIVLG